MNTIQRKAIEANIVKIDKMELSELILFTQKLYLAKEALAPVIFKWTRAACDKQMMHLMERSENSALAVMSEVSAGDIGL